MRRDIFWTRSDGPGLEHLRLAVDDAAVQADGAVIGLTEGTPFRLRYHVRCDGAWHLTGVEVEAIGLDGPVIRLCSDGHGRWSTPAGEQLSTLDGCLDVDLAVTPFTNTLPIRRLGLQPGEVRELRVVYIDAPSPAVYPVRQRYTCLARDAGGALYRYESLPGENWREPFVAELPVDADGLVRDYPGVFRRMWSS